MQISGTDYNMHNAHTYIVHRLVQCNGAIACPPQYWGHFSGYFCPQALSFAPPTKILYLHLHTTWPCMYKLFPQASPVFTFHIFQLTLWLSLLIWLLATDSRHLYSHMGDGSRQKRCPELYHTPKDTKLPDGLAENQHENLSEKCNYLIWSKKLYQVNLPIYQGKEFEIQNPIFEIC